MCGINGILGSHNKDLLLQMNKSIAHRGPDNSGIFLGKNFSLGHTRLSILDLSSSSDQPFVSNCGNYVITYNGEIYNFLEIKQKLESLNYTFKSSGDTEVLLNLLIEFNINDALEMLNGIFSFAFVDIRKNLCYVVRDNFGIKPLYYHVSDNHLTFSSELKGVLQNKNIPRKLNPDSIKSYIKYLWCPGPFTPIQNVFKLEPGSYLKISLDKPAQPMKTIYYKKPSYSGDYSFEKSFNELKLSLEKSVDEQLISDVEVGAFLSGGLDSSLICSMAKKKSNNFKNVFTIDTGKNNDGFVRDYPYAQSVSNIHNLNLNCIKSDSTDISFLSECIYYLDEPQADPAIIQTYKICKLAKDKGIKVLLSGSGADDILTGYRRHKISILVKLISNVPKFILEFFNKILPSKNIFLNRAKRLLTISMDYKQYGLIAYFNWCDEEIVNKLVLNSSNDDQLMDSLKAIKKDNTSETEKLLRVDNSFFLVDHNLNYMDKMGMAHGVEVRVPFVVKSLFKTASRIPTHLKQKKGTGKYILKKIAENFLPKSIIYREKTGFGSPVRSWIKGPLESDMKAILLSKKFQDRNIFNRELVEEIINDNSNDKKDYSYLLLSLMCIEIWCRQFIDPEIPSKEIKI
jgi:asparagine synthase (glutamine-hydrolysing)